MSYKSHGEIYKTPDLSHGEFEDDDIDEKCFSPYHHPPMNMHIPHGKKYRHTCPSCGCVKYIKSIPITYNVHYNI